LGISLLRLVLAFVSSRSLRRAQENDEWRAEGVERAEMEAEGQPPAEEPPTQIRATYEEIFQVQPNVDGGSLAGAPEDEEWQAEQAKDEWQAEGDEGTEMEAEGQPPAEEPPTEEPPTEEPAPTSEEDLQALQPDSDGAVDQVKAPETDVEPQESLRRMREEFKARAKEAELRVKQREAELHEAASAPESKQ